MKRKHGEEKSGEMAKEKQYRLEYPNIPVAKSKEVVPPIKTPVQKSIENI